MSRLRARTRLALGAMASVFVGLLAVVNAAPSDALIAQYSIVDLGPGTATDINNAGVVVGNRSGNDGFRWAAGQSTAISAPANRRVQLEAINESGVIVGNEQCSGVCPPGVDGSTGFKWVNGTKTYFDGSFSSEVNDINDANLIVGLLDGRAWAWNDSGQAHLGQPSSLPYVPMAVNNSNVIVGGAGGRFAIVEFPWRWDNFAYTGLAQGSAWANDVNDAGVIVGRTTPPFAGPGGPFAVRWDGGVRSFVGNLGSLSIAEGVNSAGVVVGYFAAAGGGGGFVADGSGMRDLNTLVAPLQGWTLGPANAINDRGQIVGWGTHNGVGSAYLLSPVALCSPPGGPISGPIWQLGVSLGVLGDNLRQLALSICRSGL